MNPSYRAAYEKYLNRHANVFKQLGRAFRFAQMEGTYDDQGLPSIKPDDIEVVNPFLDESGVNEVWPFDVYEHQKVVHWMRVVATRCGFFHHLEEQIKLFMDAHKRFICVWGDGYYQQEERYKEVELSFFTEDEGYSSEDIEIINDLRHGESYNVPDVINKHSVVRIV